MLMQVGYAHIGLKAEDASERRQLARVMHHLKAKGIRFEAKSRFSDGEQVSELTVYLDRPHVSEEWIDVEE